MASPRKSSRLENKKPGPCYLRQSGFVCNCCSDELEENPKSSKAQEKNKTSLKRDSPCPLPLSKKGRVSPRIAEASNTIGTKADEGKPAHNSSLEKQSGKYPIVKVEQLSMLKKTKGYDVNELFVTKLKEDEEEEDVQVVNYKPKKRRGRPPKHKDMSLFVQSPALVKDKETFESEMGSLKEVKQEGDDLQMNFEKIQVKPGKEKHLFSPNPGVVVQMIHKGESEINGTKTKEMEGQNQNDNEIAGITPMKDRGKAPKPLFVQNKVLVIKTCTQGSIGKNDNASSYQVKNSPAETLKKDLDKHYMEEVTTESRQETASVKYSPGVIINSDDHNKYVLNLERNNSCKNVVETDGMAECVTSDVDRLTDTGQSQSLGKVGKRIPEGSMDKDAAKITLLNVLKKRNTDSDKTQQTPRKDNLSIPEIFPMVAAVVSTDIMTSVSSEWSTELQAVADKTKVSFILTEDMVVAHGNWISILKARDQLHQVVKGQREKAEKEKFKLGSADTELVDETVKSLLGHVEDDDMDNEENDVLSLQPADHLDFMRDAFLGEGTDEHLETDVFSAAPSGTVENDLNPPDKDTVENELNPAELNPADKVMQRYRRTCTFVREPGKACYECSLCGYKSTYFGMKKHKLRHHSKNQAICLICKRVFGVRYDMRRHRLSHFTEDGFLLPEPLALWKRTYPDKEPVKLKDLEKNFVPCELMDVPEMEDGKLKSVFKHSNSPGTTKKHASIGVFGDVRVRIANSASVRYPHRANIMCTLCGFWSTENGIRKHRRRHHPKLAYECIYCKRRFGITNDLLRHVARHQRNNGVMPTLEEVRDWAVCNVCSYSGAERAVAEHVKTAHPGDHPSVSGKSKHQAASDITLNSQLSGDIPANEVQLELGGNSTASSVEDKKPLLGPLPRGRPRFRMSGKRPLPSDGERFMCPICQKVLDPKHYTRHVNSHNKLHQKCKICPFSGSGAELVQHAKEAGHEGKGEFKCTVCDKKYTSYSSFRYHAKSHDRKEEECNQPCPFCEKQFKARRFLNVHIRRVHERVSKHHCDVCGKGFFEHVRMVEHREIHKTEEEQEANKKFTCSYCGRRFLRRVQLSQHENTHTGRKPYVCKFCPKRFASAASAHKHKLVHTNERPFKCTVCSKAFKFQYKLTSHMIIHTKESQHVCHKCGKIFTMYATLKRHQCSSVVFPSVTPIIDTYKHEEIIIDIPEGQSSEPAEQYLIQDSSGHIEFVSGPDELNADQGEGGNQSSVMFMCGVCQQIFTSMEDVNVHMAAAHGHQLEVVMDPESGQEVDLKSTLEPDTTVLDVTEVKAENVFKLLEEAGHKTEICIEIPSAGNVSEEAEAVANTLADLAQ